MKYGHFNDEALPDNLNNVPQELKELYKLNSFGYRCPEWTPMPDGKKNVAILGCSHTFGQGLAEDEHWVHLISKFNTQRLRYWNLGSPGASGDRIVRTLYGCEKIIFPKVIIVCWPDWSRREKHEKDLTWNQPGADESLRYENDGTDLHNFLKNVFFVEKYAEMHDCKTFHCFAQDSYYKHLKHVPGLSILEDSLKDCWPYWSTIERTELLTPSVARDGTHYGKEHQDVFAKKFLDLFCHKLK